MKIRRGVAALLALCVLLGASAVAAGRAFDDHEAIMIRYNELIAGMPSEGALKMYVYEAGMPDYLNEVEDIQISFGDWGGVVYELPSSGMGNLPMIYLARAIESMNPSVSGFADWAEYAMDGDTYDCGLFHAEFSITATETTDNILCLRMEY